VSRKVTGTIIQDNKEQMAYYGREEMIASNGKEPPPPEWLKPSSM
jgi:hypothetical protein